MAKLFLSYCRKDETKARRFTEWLERDGHDVWRDEDDIGGGASFSQEIESALKDSTAVLVLWSVDSVKSAWVRDEAGYGRDAGKLIPFSLDGTEPPLGFRQFQSIDLSRWKGHREPVNADRIGQAIARVTGAQHIEPRSAAPVKRGWRDAIADKGLVFVGVVAVIALVIAGVVVGQRWSANQQIAIAVLPSPQSADKAMAADYANVAAADMAAFLPRRFDRASVIAPSDSSGQASAYPMEISVDPHGTATNATLILLDKDGRTTLWSENWSVADASAADLKGQVSTAASRAALCLTDAKGASKRLSQPALGLYLSGCTGLGGTKLSKTDFVTIFEKVTKLYPDFGPGWDYLALSRSWIAEGLQEGSPKSYAAALKSTQDAIGVARMLNPNSAMSYDAEYHLISRDTFRALQVLEQGAKIDPADGRIQMHLSDELRAVGRMRDSVEAAQSGVELEPGSSFTTYQYIVALAYSAQFSRAKAAVASARAKWPNDDAIELADFIFQSHYGDPRTALQLLPKIADNDADIEATRKVIEARLDPSPAKIDAAIAALRSQSPNEADNLDVVLSWLAAFGRTEEAYKFLDDPTFQPALERMLLFRPEFAAIRADPRFMGVAARLGLLRYWRQSGTWPDFCTTEKLRYDCKTQAAKYK
jgi:hypothetical protein